MQEKIARDEMLDEDARGVHMIARRLMRMIVSLEVFSSQMFSMAIEKEGRRHARDSFRVRARSTMEVMKGQLKLAQERTQAKRVKREALLFIEQSRTAPLNIDARRQIILRFEAPY